MMSEEQPVWSDVCRLDDIPRRGARVVKTPNGCVALFRTSTDEVFALDDRCPHKNGPLSQGIVHDGSVTCPLHNWVISLETGLVKGPDEGTVKTYPVKTIGEQIQIDMRRLGVDAS